MAKDSQMDSKAVREEKSNGGPTMGNSASQNESRNGKKQSGNRKKSGDDKK